MAMKTIFANPYLPSTLAAASGTRSFAVWSSPKDPALEAALSRNRRWIVNNQIKNLILRYPTQSPPVRFIQTKFKTLDLQGKALNWLRKYPCCFDLFPDPDSPGAALVCLTKRMAALVDEEAEVLRQSEPRMARSLARLLLMAANRRLNVVKLGELKRSFGFPDDYLLRVVPSHPDLYRLINRGGRRSSMELELVGDPDIAAVSAAESRAARRNAEPGFEFGLPLSWTKSWERFQEFNGGSPYISPYSEAAAAAGLEAAEKRAVGVVHELLSLTLWKKASIVKLGHFKREFGLPEKLNALLLRHPGIFYVSNRYKIYTVVLRDGYCGKELVEKDPLVVVKDKFGELMQEGLHEYNRRRCEINLEKKRKKGLIKLEKLRAVREVSESDDCVESSGGLYNPEERKRFYTSLFDDDAPGD